MKVDAKPLSKSEWTRFREYLLADNVTSELHADRIEATVEHGWAPDEPSNPELDVWAAETVMGWARRKGGSYWLDDSDSLRAQVGHWRPSTDLAQALRVAMETPSDVHLACEEVYDDRGNRVKTATATVGLQEVHRSALDHEAIARKIMLQLHRELE